MFVTNQRVHLEQNLGKCSSVIGRNQPMWFDDTRGRLVDISNIDIFKKESNNFFRMDRHDLNNYFRTFPLNHSFFQWALRGLPPFSSFSCWPLISLRFKIFSQKVKKGPGSCFFVFFDWIFGFCFSARPNEWAGFRRGESSSQKRRHGPTPIPRHDHRFWQLATFSGISEEFKSLLLDNWIELLSKFTERFSHEKEKLL